MAMRRRFVTHASHYISWVTFYGDSHPASHLKLVLEHASVAPAVTATDDGQVKRMQTQKNPAYLTDHLYLAAYLTCSGHEIIGTSSAGGRVSFEFTQTQQLSSAVASFMSGTLVPARKFSFEVLKLKRLIPGQTQTVKRDFRHAEEEIPR
jgi:hypothetical protein